MQCCVTAKGVILRNNVQHQKEMKCNSVQYHQCGPIRLSWDRSLGGREATDILAILLPNAPVLLPLSLLIVTCYHVVDVGYRISGFMYQVTDSGYQVYRVPAGKHPAP